MFRSAEFEFPSATLRENVDIAFRIIARALSNFAGGPCRAGLLGEENMVQPSADRLIIKPHSDLPLRKDSMCVQAEDFRPTQL
jgi:hypothetical protein